MICKRIGYWHGKGSNIMNKPPSLPTSPHLSLHPQVCSLYVWKENSWCRHNICNVNIVCFYSGGIWAYFPFHISAKNYSNIFIFYDKFEHWFYHHHSLPSSIKYISQCIAIFQWRFSLSISEVEVDAWPQYLV